MISLTFSRNKIFAVALGLLFATLVLLKLHGFSITIWKDIIDGSAHEEVIFGHNQAIRGDDYLVALPTIISQINHSPPFPVYNTLIGHGQNMLAVFPVPIKHWISIFRPQLWGYFISAEYGIAWNWWFNFLGLFFSFFLVFNEISEGDLFLSFWASITLVFAAFFQFWSLNSAPAAIFTACSFLFFIRLLEAKNTAHSIFHAILLGWSGTCLLFVMYPPFQITLGYLFLFMAGGFLITPKFSLMKKSTQALFLIIPIIIFGAASFYFFDEIKEFVKIILNTSYPGRRESQGGAFDLVFLFSNNFLPFPWLDHWDNFVNICEAGSFIFFFPLIGSKILINAIIQRKLPKPFPFFIILYITFILIWDFYGIPKPLSQWLFLTMVPEGRTYIGLGIANIVLAVWYLANANLYKFDWISKSLLMLWTTFLVYVGLKVKTFSPDLSTYAFGGALIVNVALSWMLIAGRRYFLVVLALLSLLMTAWFNPLVKNGLDYMYNNPLSKKILELDAQKNQNSNWVTFGGAGLPNLFRLLGVHSIDGVHFYPQFDIWNILDPEKKYYNIYNSYAHIHFRLADNSETTKFESPMKGEFFVDIHPSNPNFQALNVDYALLVGDNLDELKAIDTWEYVFSYHNRHIFKIKSR